MSESIGTGSEYQVTIPSYADNADIQTAIKLLMYGTEIPVTQNSQIQNSSLAGYIKTLDSRIDSLASTEVVQLTTPEDLNTRTSNGKFIQASNSNAETGTNYPTFLTKKWAGSLTVNVYDGNVFQFYEGQAGTSGAVTSQGFIAWRSLPKGQTWSPWVIASDTSHIHDDRYFTEQEVTDKLTALTKTSVGLENVDNTSDANKPVSTLQQEAIDGRLSLASGGTILSGAILLPSASPTNGLQAVTKNYVDTGLANKPTSIADNIFIQATAPTISSNPELKTGDLWFW